MGPRCRLHRAVNEIPWGILAPVLVAVGVVDVLVLLDLRRREVVGPPKIVWALIILFVSFPVGVLVYWFGGRVRPSESPPDATPRRWAPPATAP